MATTSSFIVAVAVITMCAGAVGQAPGMAPGPSSYVRIPPPPQYGEIAPGPYITMPPESMGPTSNDCFTYVLNMSDCLSYVQTGSNLTVPEKPCCPELAGLLESHPLCLCELVGSAGTYGVNITKALSLPGACGLPPLSLSLCPGSFLASLLRHLIFSHYYLIIDKEKKISIVT